MSHTTYINDVVITDVGALRAAIEELKSNGVRCDLLENATPRAYYQSQSGMGQAPYVLQLKDSRYDVGFYYDESKKGYQARADLFAGEVNKQVGDFCSTDDYKDHDRGSMGKLYKLYAVHAATRKAIQQGYTVRRINKADGSVQLRVMAA